MTVEAILDPAVPHPPTSIGFGSRARTRDGRVVGRVAGSTPLWLLVRSGWWSPLTLRVAMDQVEAANHRGVRLAVSADGFFNLPVYIADDEIGSRVWKVF
jgi:hypothetical protein